jgi:hypothetical protein
MSITADLLGRQRRAGAGQPLHRVQPLEAVVAGQGLAVVAAVQRGGLGLGEADVGAEVFDGDGQAFGGHGAASSTFDAHPLAPT